MALTATVYRLQVDLSDVDRGVYETLDLRLARHPSETMRYLLTRALAYCLCYEEGVAFSKGLFVTDEPAVWRREPDGRVALWVDIGRPAMDRLHKASKLGARVVVFTHLDPETLRADARAARVHRGEAIEVCSVDVALLDALEGVVDRNASLSLTRTEGRLYVTVGDRTLEGDLTTRPLVDA